MCIFIVNLDTQTVRFSLPLQLYDKNIVSDFEDGVCMYLFSCITKAFDLGLVTCLYKNPICIFCLTFYHDKISQSCHDLDIIPVGSQIGDVSATPALFCLSSRVKLTCKYKAGCNLQMLQWS